MSSDSTKKKMEEVERLAKEFVADLDRESKESPEGLEGFREAVEKDRARLAGERFTPEGIAATDRMLFNMLMRNEAGQQLHVMMTKGTQETTEWKLVGNMLRNISGLSMLAAIQSSQIRYLTDQLGQAEMDRDVARAALGRSS